MTVPQVLHLIYEQITDLERSYAHTLSANGHLNPKLTVLDAQLTTLRELALDIEENYDGDDV